MHHLYGVGCGISLFLGCSTQCGITLNHLIITKDSSAIEKTSWLECQDFDKYVYFQVRLYVTFSSYFSIVTLRNLKLYNVPVVGYTYYQKGMRVSGKVFNTAFCSHSYGTPCKQHVSNKSKTIR